MDIRKQKTAEKGLFCSIVVLLLFSIWQTGRWLQVSGQAEATLRTAVPCVVLDAGHGACRMVTERRSGL